MGFPGAEWEEVCWVCWTAAVATASANSAGKPLLVASVAAR